jgi:hypothetical protein
MGAGRGARRRARRTHQSGGLRRARLNELCGGRARFTRYAEAVRFRTPEGDECRVFLVEEHGVRQRRGEARTSLLVVEENDLFWVVGAAQADAEPAHPPVPRLPGESVPFRDATYWCARRNTRLREHNGQRCRVYAVEERRAGRGERGPVRYGIRFPGDEAYWVVPANELILSQL